MDYDYRFVEDNAGIQGRISYGGVFKNSEMYFALENNKFSLLESCRLPLTEDDESDSHSSSVPFVFVADDAFQLTSYCMKPYGRKNMIDGQRIFDFTENVFGNLVNGFRVFSARKNLNEINVSIVAFTSLSLHNLVVRDHVIPIHLLFL